MVVDVDAAIAKRASVTPDHVSLPTVVVSIDNLVVHFLLRQIQLDF
jgi:hypothetical protein